MLAEEIQDMRKLMYLDTEKLIESAKKYCDQHPAFKPAFTRIANIVVNANDETVAMTKWAIQDSGADGGAIDMWSYGHAMLAYTGQTSSQ